MVTIVDFLKFKSFSPSENLSVRFIFWELASLGIDISDFQKIVLPGSILPNKNSIPLRKYDSDSDEALKR